MGLLALAAALAVVVVARAAVVMPAVFSDNMVLQTNAMYGQRAFFYGTAAPGEGVQVNRTSPGGGGGPPEQEYAAVAGVDGRWVITLNAEGSSGSFTFTVAGSADGYAAVTTLSNVVYGDVFLCSGQSNMVFSAKSAFNASAITSLSYPFLHLFPVVHGGAPTPQDDVPPYTGASTPCWWEQNPRPDGSAYVCNAWQPATPGISDEFSAVCLFTALEIAAVVPGRHIGLIYAAFDGTPMQAWSPPEALAACNATADGALPAAASTSPNDPSVLFNAMINPLSRFSIRAVLWYQGESDSGDSAALFSCKFRALIASWRARWRIGDFAWAFVQLAPQDEAAWPQYYMLDARLGQAGALPAPGVNSTDTTGMAVAYDLGDLGSPYPPSHVHPRNKTEVARRLAAAVLHTQYGWQWPAGGANLTNTVNWRGPVAVAAAPGGSGSFAITFHTLDGRGVYLADTADCWECCARGGDTVQLSDAAGVVWVNATVAVAPGNNATIVATPAGAPPSPSGFTLARYAANLWPQCAVYAAGNAIPAPPFVIPVSASGEARAESPPPPPPSPARAHTTLPLKAFGPRTWGTWHGTRMRDTPAAASDLPPMGYNSWNAAHCNVDEAYIRAVADAFISLGLDKLGYEYVNVDDCMHVDRLPNNGSLVIDPVRFPSGGAALAEYIHSRGLKFGVYTAAHSLTCQVRPGSYAHELVDAATFCAYGIDYLKVDGCGGTSWPALNTSWIRFRQGLDACAAGGGRSVVLSVETCGVGNQDDCQAWIGGLANAWRTTDDIQATWASILANLDGNNPLAHLAGPGHWNDPDILEIGNPGLTDDEQRAHFAAWAVVASPLLIGTDLTSGLDNATLAILTAPEVLAIARDPLGVQGVRVSPPNADGGECWARPLADGSVAALLLNRGTPSSAVTCTWAELDLPPGATAAVRDAWARANVGNFTGSYTVTVRGHAAALVTVTPV